MQKRVPPVVTRVSYSPGLINAQLVVEEGITTLESFRSPVLEPYDSELEPVIERLSQRCWSVRKTEWHDNPDEWMIGGAGLYESFYMFDACPGSITEHSCYHERSKHVERNDSQVGESGRVLQ